MDTPEACPNQATRQTPLGPLCDAHRRRQQPSRNGGVELHAPVAKRQSPRDRLRQTALEYADADGDSEYKLADDRLARAAKSFASADGAESVEAYKAARSRAHSRRIKEGIAKAKDEGKVWWPAPKLTREEADRAVHRYGGIRAAARALGVSRDTVRCALRRVGAEVSTPHGELHSLAPAPRPPADPDSEES